MYENDDSCGLQSEFSTYVEAGTYFIVVDGYSAIAMGEFSLYVDCPIETVSADDQAQSIDLIQSYPNPFNPTTTIDFSVAEMGNASLKVYNLNGEIVTTLVDGLVEMGAHSVIFDGSHLASGMYIIVLESVGHKLSNKMLLMR